MNETGETGGVISSKRITTRRDFLRGTCLVGAALMSKSIVGPVAAAFAQNQQTREPASLPGKVVEASAAKDQQERFKEMGMGEFWSFYKEVMDTTNKFGARNDGYYFNRIFNICQQVADGKITNPEDSSLTSIRDGWGEKEKSVVDDALAHIQSLNIQNHDTTGDPEKFRQQQLTTFARAFAPMALALPPDIYLTRMAAQTNAELLATVSFEDWGAGEAWERFFHEVTHAADVWSDRIQPYVSKEQFLEYASTYYRLADELITGWLNTPDLETARSYWQGFIKAWGDNISAYESQTMPVIARVEKDLFNQEFSQESPLYRFERVAWTAGKKIQAIRAKQLSNDPITSDEEKLLNNSDIQLVMTWVVEESLHFLVNAPEDAFYREPEPKDSLGRQARVKMNDVRVNTFASFELNPDQDIDHQIKAQLGIMEPHG